jgi:hypothetical protein
MAESLPELNPYAPPVTADPPNATLRGPLFVRFHLEDDGVLLPRIRASMPTDAAEHVGVVVCITVLLLATIPSIVLLRPAFMILGLVTAVVLAFSAREVWLRRMARRYLHVLRHQLDAGPDAYCRLQLTRTRLMVHLPRKRLVWRIRDLVLRYSDSTAHKPPWMLMALILKTEVVLPLPLMAEFEDSTPADFQREFEGRSGDCWYRRNRFRSYKCLRLPSAALRRLFGAPSA